MRLLDAQSALAFLVNQLSFIEPEVYKIQYPDYAYEEFIPVDTSAPEWIKTIEFFSLDLVGSAQWLAGGADDIRKADAIRARGSHAIYLAGVGYGYNLEEISTASYMGLPLTTDKADAARQAYTQFMYAVATTGNTEKNLLGIMNQSSVTAGNVAADGTASSTYWADKTPALILRDINAVLQGVFDDSATVEMADTLLLPWGALFLLNNTPMSATNSETILTFLLKNNVYTAVTGRPLVIRALRGLENAAASSKGRMIAYKRDAKVLKLHLPMRHKFLEVYRTGPLRWDVPGIFRTGGVEVRRPGAMRYGDLITS